jgi:signal transduction histidine kinase
MAPYNTESLLFSYHVLCAAAAGVLLLCVGWMRTFFGSLLAVHAVLGYFSFAAPDQSSALLVSSWRAISVLVMLVLLAALLWKFKVVAGTKQGLVAIGGLWGLAIVVEDLLVNAPAAPNLRVMHLFFGVFLLLLWLLLSGHFRWVHMPTEYVPPALPVKRTGFGGLSEFSLNSEVQSTRNYSQSIVADERKRIAQDIHDGVGTQLVGLIGSLDADSPSHKRLRLGLECCLLDLKMTIDNMESDAANIFDALGSLRYRFTPSLQRAGIRMVWRVETAGQLLALPPSSVANVMRIVQESLANVLVHSGAKKVRVACRYEPEPPRMLLEVQDDGTGMAQEADGARVGKGLPGMRERAHNLGATIDIDTKLGVGTRVRLQVPVG